MTRDGGGWTLIAEANEFTSEVDGAQLNPFALDGNRNRIMRVSQRTPLLNATTSVFRASPSTGSERLFIRDPGAVFDNSRSTGTPPQNSWATANNNAECAADWTAASSGIWNNAPTNVRGGVCTANGEVGDHICGNGNGWFLWNRGDTYNVGNNHPCIPSGTSASVFPTGQKLYIIWVK